MTQQSNAMLLNTTPSRATAGRIAFAALGRPTFDIPLAQQVTRQALDQLHQAGFELFTPADRR